MTTRQTRLLIRAASATLLIGAIAALAWAFTRPPTALDYRTAPAARAKPSSAPLASPALDELAAVWDRRLQGPLVDAVAAMPREEVLPDAVPEEPAEQAGMALVGTMREEGRSVAIFLNPTGGVELKQAGETIELPAGSMRIERIESGEVTLTGAGESLTLRLPAAGAP